MSKSNLFTFFLFVQIISGKWKGVHFILDDPAGNSYVQVSYKMQLLLR